MAPLELFKNYESIEKNAGKNCKKIVEIIVVVDVSTLLTVKEPFLDLSQTHIFPLKYKKLEFYYSNSIPS